MSYEPRPIDTAHIALPEFLDPLRERLAENAHDLWACQRLASGWTWGPERDDPARKHPCLVPYADLPETEKVYDRQTTEGTLKAILALGFIIQPK